MRDQTGPRPHREAGRVMSLSDASRALEIIDARLVAVQSRLTEIRSTRDEILKLAEIVDQLDLVIGDVRGAAEDIVKHTCPPEPETE